MRQAEPVSSVTTAPKHLQISKLTICLTQHQENSDATFAGELWLKIRQQCQKQILDSF